MQTKYAIFPKIQFLTFFDMFLVSINGFARKMNKALGKNYRAVCKAPLNFIFRPD